MQKETKKRQCTGVEPWQCTSWLSMYQVNLSPCNVPQAKSFTWYLPFRNKDKIQCHRQTLQICAVFCHQRHPMKQTRKTLSLSGINQTPVKKRPGYRTTLKTQENVLLKCQENKDNQIRLENNLSIRYIIGLHEKTVSNKKYSPFQRD